MESILETLCFSAYFRGFERNTASGPTQGALLGAGGEQVEICQSPVSRSQLAFVSTREDRAKVLLHPGAHYVPSGFIVLPHSLHAVGA